MIYNLVQDGNTIELRQREISWLSFNERVLQEAANKSVPLLERLKYLAIFSSNMDEFFRVRVATLRRMSRLRIKNDKSTELSNEIILQEIHKEVVRLQEIFEEAYTEVIEEMKIHGFVIKNETELSGEEVLKVETYFNTEVLSQLSPIILDNNKSLPVINDKYIYLIILLEDSASNQLNRTALLQLPSKILPRFYIIPQSSDENTSIILLDDIIRLNLRNIFPMFDYERFNAYTIKITRDAELNLESDVQSNIVEKLNSSLKKRKYGFPVRFIYDAQLPQSTLQFIINKLNLSRSELLPGGRYHNFKDYLNFPQVGPKAWRYQSLTPLPVSELSGKSMMTAIEKGDILIHHPYNSFEATIRFLREAALDPEVESIHCTLYRVAKQSNICNALINAVGNGKKVTVFLEIKARFDEENNLNWLEKFQEAGVKVLPSFEHLKVHAKMCLVTKRVKGKTQRFAHLSTGNYNGQTAKIYCDEALFTAHKGITMEVLRVFNLLESPEKVYRFNHLFVAPHYMRNEFISLIQKEIQAATSNKKSGIMLKMNSLVDEEMIGNLYRAVEAGVKVEMVVRGICMMVPPIKTSKKQFFKAISIVDKFLEHSRIFVFENNGAPKVYLSSADWMQRNLNARFEVAFPIYDEKIKARIISYLELQLKDNFKGRVLDRHQTNQIPHHSGPIIRAQEVFYSELAKI
jgi:polyphosphate kinase